MNQPLAYFITFTCYGSHLHGNDECSIDRQHNQFGMKSLEPSPSLLRYKKSIQKEAPYLLDKNRRAVVLENIQEVCAYKKWQLLAAHVRVNHIHLVVQAGKETPESIMRSLKSYASRALNQSFAESPRRKRWARHGSTRYIWTAESLKTVVEYVKDGQGPPMSLFLLRNLTIIT
jgi:REP element-mobilizing transposase RayT